MIVSPAAKAMTELAHAADVALTQLAPAFEEHQVFLGALHELYYQRVSGGRGESTYSGPPRRCDYAEWLADGAATLVGAR